MKKDFVATIATGMHPFMVSYGFEEFARLAGKIGVPDEVISRTPADFHARVCHALDIDCAESPGRWPARSSRILVQFAG